jgi:O-acetylhomoserine/O-acetylserine sulfhydrylase-like pyridoxal-dependent enzyme
MAASMSDELLRPPLRPPLRLETVAAHSLSALDPETGAIVPPLHTSTTYARDADHAIEGPTSPVPANLIRLSIGLEAVEDLIGDLEQALAGI